METVGILDAWRQPVSTPRILKKLSCALFGHAVDNRRFQAEGPEKSCPCGSAILHEDGRETRTRHTLSCFFRHQSYVRVGTRHGHWSFPRFALYGTAGRLLRFSAVLFLPGLLKGMVS